MEVKISTENGMKRKQNTSYKMNKIKLIECVREFHLPQQFPSTLKEATLVTSQKNKNLPNITQFPIVPLTTPKFVTTSSNTNCIVPCKKLRIMSPNGKDLGEFNVEMRKNQNNPSKQQITISKSNIFKPIAKQIEIIPENFHASRRTFPRILRHESVKTVNNKFIEVTLSNQCTFNNNGINNKSLKLRSVTLPIKEMFIVNQDVKLKKLPTCSDNISANKIISVDEKNIEQYTDHVVNDSQKCIEADTPIESMKDSRYVVNDINVVSEIPTALTSIDIKDSLVTESKLYKKIADSPFPIVSCTKLAINSSDNNHLKTHLKLYDHKCNDKTTQNAENKQIITSSNSVSNSTQGYNQIDKDSNRKSIEIDSKENHNKQRFLGDKNNLSQVACNIIYGNKQVPETKIQKNIMTVIPNNDDDHLFNKNAVCTSRYTTASLGSKKNINNIDHNKVTHDTNDIICDNIENEWISMKVSENDDLSLDKDVQFITESRITPKTINAINITNTSMQDKDCHMDSSQKDLSDQLHIIQKAMSSIKDNKLRIQALKALADCGIGIERHVPICPPEKLKAVHDTQMQTAIFGLLDPKSFVLVNKDLDGIQRIQVTLDNIPSTQDPLGNNLYSCNNSLSNMNEQESYFDIESFINEICEKNSNALKVQEALSTTNTKYKKIIEQLQKDFESIKKYDQNGMLNIHKAVVNNNFFDVQRQLMILKQCKENVDILTENKETSLELAVKYNISSEIVKLLLQAGAQPVIRKAVNDSALIISCKQSSALLPMLVNYVSDFKLFDQVDSEGLAPLHYCCIRGNLQGVNVLLSAGTNINLKDMKSGRTPLFHAMDNNHKSVVQKLLNAGAIANIANFAGHTPMPITSVNDGKNVPFKISLSRNDVT